MKKLKGLFKPEKRSSELVLVYFSASDEKTSKNISDSIKKEISKNVDDLNFMQKDANWFQIVAQNPVIIRHSFDLRLVIAGFLLLGIFLAFWVVLVKHYFK